jgi:16S rRNA (cytosine967-C5)-methyltransferase
MRRAAREGPAVVDRIVADTPAGAALLHSHPSWLAELWWETLGPAETAALLERDNEAPELAVRANELVTTRDELAVALGDAGIASEPAEGLPEGLVLEPGSDPGSTELFEAGALVPQSRGSMLVGRVVAPEPGQTVLDMCAAPGAKATHLAALMGDEGELHAIELGGAAGRGQGSRA